MPVIKEFESRVDDIEQLTQLLKEHSNNPKLKKRIESDLIKLRVGEKAERNAGYMLGTIYKDRSESFLINGLRLDFDGDIAQIDHITLNSIGVVFLIETKSVSTGIKIDEAGVFWRWDSFKKTYIEIPSPLKQSERHERVIRKAFEKIGYEPELIKHLIVVDYKEKLIKPKYGFENICRPDMVEKAIEDSLQKTHIVKAFKLVGKMFLGNRYTKLQTRVFAQNLIAMHQPITFDYRQYYGLEQGAENQIKPLIQESKQEYSANNLPEKVTFSKYAKLKAMKTNQLETLMIFHGYLEKREKGVFLTEKAKLAGIEVKKGRYGFYFLVPTNFVI